MQELKYFKNNYEYKIDLEKIDLVFLQNLLHKSNDLLISLIASENLHDHETFTEMLIALIYLTEEIDTRYSLQIEDYENEHITEDLSTVYKYLTYVWFHYMYYLSKNYPSLFVKVLINNTFDTRFKHEKDSIFLNKYKIK